jgi:phage minor structural protein
MIPRLYESTETAFSTFGICPLSDAISCTVTEERNGQYTLEMEYPTNGMWFDEIKVDRIILAQAHESDAQTQPFRIETISGDMGGVVTIGAVHVSYQLNWIILTKMTKYTRYAQQAMFQMKRDALTVPDSCPFDFYSDIGTAESTPVYIGTTQATPFRTYLGGMDGSVLDTYGGEFEWDRWDVHLWKARGKDNGVRITYGKNLTGLDWDTDVSDTYTSVIAYWKQEEDSTITYVSSDIQSVGTNTFAFQRTIAVDATSEFQSRPTVAQLNSYAQSYVKSNALAPTVSVKADFVPLWQTEEYKEYADFERVGLCDTVTIVYPPLNLELEAKVVKTVYNVLLDRYDSIEINTMKKTLADTIFAMQKEIRSK